MAVVRQQRLRPLAQWCAEGLFVFCGRLFEAFSGALQGAAGSCRGAGLSKRAMPAGLARAAHRGHLRLAPGKDASFLVLDAPSSFEAIRQRAGVLRFVRRGEELFTRVPAQTRSKYDLLA